MDTHNWKLDDNRSIINLLLQERDITIVILYREEMERTRIMTPLRLKIGSYIEKSSLWSMKLYNDNLIVFVPIQRAQIDTKGYTISLLLFPSSIEYEWRQKITRELYPQMIRDGGITGTINI